MLLAKSDEDDPNRSLRAHTERVVEGVIQLQQLWPFLPNQLVDAAWFHDFGKAASGFQKALLPQGKPWKFRHEVLSAEIFRCCYDLSNTTVFLCYLALLTHHKNLGSQAKVSEILRECEDGEGSRWPQKWNETQVDQLRETFPEHLSEWRFDARAKSPANELKAYLSLVEPAFDNLLLAWVRGALVAADHLASSGIGTTIAGGNITLDAVETYAKALPDWTSWSPMQKQVQATNGNALLTAPTGAGKTEAALLWAIKNRNHGERIFYVLPYQVSINAMAQRLNDVFPAESQVPTALHENDTITVLHSNTDLAYLQDAMNDAASPDEARKIAGQKKNSARKIYSPVKVTTVYQLLDIFFGRKFFEVGLLELTNSLVIFDEIHAYDGHTMGLILVLLDCLHQLNARVFIMTATLPTQLKNKLQEAAQIPADKEITLQDDDPLLKEVRREIICHDEKIENLLPEIRAAVASGKKTAVVCNTVDKAITLYDALSDLDPFLVHSRFTFGDRAERETQENIKKQKLVISTQVIEVSLDVSFGVMFTELGPADSLLQRFGRVNRHGKPTAGNLGICHIACADDTGSGIIYDKKLLENTLKFLRESLNEKPLTFPVACDWIEAVYPNGLTPQQTCIMDEIQGKFQQVVNGLRPMLDPPIDVELELTLFDSVQVIPVKFEKKWCDFKKEKNHMEARRLLVNVARSSWEGALKKGRDLAEEKCRKITFDNKPYIVALCEYDENKGLLLNTTVPPDINDQFC